MRELFEKLVSGWQVFKESFPLFSKYPKLLIPFVVTQLLYFLFCAALLLAAVTFYRHAGVTEPNPRVCIGLAFLFLLTNGILLVLSASVVLELIEQHESGQPMRLSRGVASTLACHLPALLVVGLFWWLARIVIGILFGRRRRGESNTAEELAEKAARMAVFMVLPAIAWEGMGAVAGIRRGLAIGRKHLAEWASGYGLSWAATRLLSVILIGAPVLFYRMAHAGPVTGTPLYIFITYVVFVALLIESYTNHLELLFCSTLYLWHLKWERIAREREAKGEPIPRIQEIPQPSLMDDVSEFGIAGGRLT